MSILGIITVFKCDGVDCNCVSSVHTDAEIESFASRWYSGYERHYCPACRTKTANLRDLARDMAEMNDICRRLDERCSSIPQIAQEVNDAVIH